MKWKVPKVWEGGQCVILGGGPSIIKQFGIPEELVKKVYSGESDPSVYSPYMERIHKEHVIGVNVSYKFGPWVDSLFFGDDSSWKEDKAGILKFKGLRVSCAVVAEHIQGVNYIKRDGKKKEGLHTDPSFICWNYNSGSAAINLATLMGAKRILLFGFDMRLDDADNQHWHKFYKTDLKTVGRSMNKHMVGFPAIAKDAKAQGIEIINVNPDSRIDQFPKIALKDLIL